MVISVPAIPPAGSLLAARSGPAASWGRNAAAAIVAVLLAVPLAAQETTFHVAASGSDAAPGTAESPFRTVQKAVVVARPGDTILVHAGEYNGSIVISTSGQSLRPITLRGAGDGEATLRASLPRRSCAETDPARDRTLEILNGSDHWVIRDLTILGGIYVSGNDLRILSDNVRNRSLPGRGLYHPDAARTTIESLGGDPADGIQILENRIRERGVYVAAARDGRIEGNEIHDIDCGIGAAVWLNRFSDGWTIRRNHIHDIAASTQHYMSEGIRLGGASMYNTIEDNTIERAMGSGRGIATDVHAGWNVIRRNRVQAAEQGFSEQSGGWGNQWLENVAEDNRRFGFNIYGQSNGLFDSETPAYLEVRCNLSTGTPAGLSIGSLTRSTFNDNDFGTVALTEQMRDQWGVKGNTWNGGQDPPPPVPPRPSSWECLPGPAPARLWGDVSRDGVVDGADAALVLNHVAGIAPGPRDATLADVDGDDRITSRDALLILQHAAGKDTSAWRVGEPAD